MVGGVMDGGSEQKVGGLAGIWRGVVGVRGVDGGRRRGREGGYMRGVLRRVARGQSAADSGVGGVQRRVFSGSDGRGRHAGQTGVIVQAGEERAQRRVGTVREVGVGFARRGTWD